MGREEGRDRQIESEGETECMLERERESCKTISISKKNRRKRYTKKGNGFLLTSTFLYV